MYKRTARALPARPWVLAVSAVVAAPVVTVVAGSHAPAVAAARTPTEARAASAHAGILGSCTFAALQKAVAKGGTIRFGCSATIQFTHPIAVAHNDTVTLDAS